MPQRRLPDFGWQDEALEKCLELIAIKGERRMQLHAPCGSGKTRTLVMLIQRVLSQIEWSSNPILVIGVSRLRLIRQWMNALSRVQWEEDPTIHVLSSHSDLGHRPSFDKGVVKHEEDAEEELGRLEALLHDVPLKCQLLRLPRLYRDCITNQLLEGTAAAWSRIEELRATGATKTQTPFIILGHHKTIGQRLCGPQSNIDIYLGDESHGHAQPHRFCLDGDDDDDDEKEEEEEEEEDRIQAPLLQLRPSCRILFDPSVYEDGIFCRLRIFTTASPRIYTPRAVPGSVTTMTQPCSMDDESLFGPVAYDLTCYAAQQVGIQVPVSVHAILIDGAFAEFANSANDILCGPTAGLDESESSIYNLIREMVMDTHNHKCLVFVDTIEAAGQVTDTLRKLLSSVETTRQWFVDEYHSALPTARRPTVLDTFERARAGILVCIESLSEGYDDPSIDTIVFCYIPRSTPKQTQVLGRAQRAFPGKESARVIVPLFIPPSVTSEMNIQTQLRQQGLDHLLLHISRTLDPESTTLHVHRKHGRQRRVDEAMPFLQICEGCDLNLLYRAVCCSMVHFGNLMLTQLGLTQLGLTQLALTQLELGGGGSSSAPGDSTLKDDDAAVIFEQARKHPLACLLLRMLEDAMSSSEDDGADAAANAVPSWTQQLRNQSVITMSHEDWSLFLQDLTARDRISTDFVRQILSVLIAYSCGLHSKREEWKKVLTQLARESRARSARKAAADAAAAAATEPVQVGEIPSHVRDIIHACEAVCSRGHRIKSRSAMIETVLWFYAHPGRQPSGRYDRMRNDELTELQLSERRASATTRRFLKPGGDYLGSSYQSHPLAPTLLRLLEDLGLEQKAYTAPRIRDRSRRSSKLAGQRRQRCESSPLPPGM